MKTNNCRELACAALRASRSATCSGGPGFASRRIAALVLATAALTAPIHSAVACGFHDPSSINLGMLNLAYPDALYVRTAVWQAQLAGQLPRDDVAPALDPQSATLRAMFRLRDIVRALDALRAAVEAGRDGRAVPAFSIVLIGPMLWTRFEQREGALVMTEHAQGPSRDDVVVVTDGPVVEALVAGRFDVQTAQARGLLRYYGAREAVDEVVALFRRASPAASGAAVRSGTSPRGATMLGDGPS